MEGENRLLCGDIETTGGEILVCWRKYWKNLRERTLEERAMDLNNGDVE